MNEKNPYLYPLDFSWIVDGLELVCDECHNVNLNLETIITPTLKYKIDQGLLLRICSRTRTDNEPLICLFCDANFPKEMWMFWKKYQNEPVLLPKIIDLQNQYNDKSHYVFNLPSANKDEQ